MVTHIVCELRLGIDIKTAPLQSTVASWAMLQMLNVPVCKVGWPHALGLQAVGAASPLASTQ